MEEQAIGQCNRFGQTVSVKVTQLVMKGTIEEKIVEFKKQRDSTEQDGECGALSSDYWDL